MCGWSIDSACTAKMEGTGVCFGIFATEFACALNGACKCLIFFWKRQGGNVEWHRRTAGESILYPIYHGGSGPSR